MDPVDPHTEIAYCPKGRRLTPMRVAGLAFEYAMRVIYLRGIWALSDEDVATVVFGSVSRDVPDGPRGNVTFLVAEPHRRALLIAAEEVACKLQEFMEVFCCVFHMLRFQRPCVMLRCLFFFLLKLRFYMAPRFEK